MTADLPDDGTPGIHPHVARQLRRALIDDVDQAPTREQWLAFLSRVSAACDEADRDRYLNDRAWELSSVEMQDLYTKLADASASEIAIQRDRLTTVLDNTTTGLCLIDKDQRIVEMNSAGAYFLGVAREAAIGESLLDVLWPDGAARSRDIAPSELRTALTSRRPWNADLVTVSLPGHQELKCGIVYTPLPLGDATTPGGVLAFHDYTLQHQAEKDLAWRATHDPLTGLLNRTAFSRYVDNALETARRAHTRSAILFIDLDRFKTVNDTVGHDAGDAVLVESADRVRRAVRAHDTVSRLGGDEFVVFLEDVPGIIDVEIVAQRIVAALRRPFAVAGEEMFLSASIGLAFSEPEQDATSMLRDADIALYEAKGSGRDRVRTFGKELRQVVQGRVDLDRRLRAALAVSELTVAYQPIIRLADDATVGFEALVRWPSADGEIEPNRFIPVAEETGQIFEIGDLVLRRTSALAAGANAGSSDWPRTGSVYAVNVSGLQLARRGFSAMVAQHLDEAGLPGNALMVEMTESTLLADTGQVRAELAELRELGVRVALDDFGTGSSSLSLLQQFTLDCIKIDRAFVGRMTSSSDDYAIVQAVVSLSHALGTTVIAEGVETQEQAQELRDLGCELAQGFHFGRPRIHPVSHPKAATVTPIESRRIRSFG